MNDCIAYQFLVSHCTDEATTKAKNAVETAALPSNGIKPDPFSKENTDSASTVALLGTEYTIILNRFNTVPDHVSPNHSIEQRNSYQHFNN